LIPACKTCGSEHYNFIGCDDHAATVAELKRRDVSPERFNRPREGEREFGNRLEGSQVNGLNVVYIPRKEHPHYQGDKT